MLLFEQLVASKFNGYGCLTIKHNDYKEFLVDNYDSKIAFLVININPTCGVFYVTIKIETRQKMYWYGNYDGAVKIPIENGINVLEIIISETQKKPFNVGIFSDGNNTYGSILLKSVTVSRTKNICNEITKNDDIIIQDSNLSTDNIISYEGFNGKKKLLIVADTKNWCEMFE